MAQPAKLARLTRSSIHSIRPTPRLTWRLSTEGIELGSIKRKKIGLEKYSPLIWDLFQLVFLIHSCGLNPFFVDLNVLECPSNFTHKFYLLFIVNWKMMWPNKCGALDSIDEKWRDIPPPRLIGSGEKSCSYIGFSYVISIISLVFLPTLT